MASAFIKPIQLRKLSVRSENYMLYTALRGIHQDSLFTLRYTRRRSLVSVSNVVHNTYSKSLKTTSSLTADDLFLNKTDSNISKKSFSSVFKEDSKKKTFGFRIKDALGRITERGGFLSKIEAEAALEEAQESFSTFENVGMGAEINRHENLEKYFKKAGENEKKLASYLSARCRQMLPENELKLLYSSMRSFVCKLNHSNEDRLQIIRNIIAILDFRGPTIYPALEEFLVLSDSQLGRTVKTDVIGSAEVEDIKRLVFMEMFTELIKDDYPTLSLDEAIPFISLQEDPTLLLDWKNNSVQSREKELSMLVQFRSAWLKHSEIHEDMLKSANFIEKQENIGKITKLIRSKLKMYKSPDSLFSKRKYIEERKRLKKLLKNQVAPVLNEIDISKVSALKVGDTSIISNDSSSIEDMPPNILREAQEFLETLSGVDLYTRSAFMQLLYDFNSQDLPTELDQASYFDEFCTRLRYSLGKEENVRVLLPPLIELIGCEHFRANMTLKEELVRLQELQAIVLPESVLLRDTDQVSEEKSSHGPFPQARSITGSSSDIFEWRGLDDIWHPNLDDSIRSLYSPNVFGDFGDHALESRTFLAVQNVYLAHEDAIKLSEINTYLKNENLNDAEAFCQLLLEQLSESEISDFIKLLGKFWNSENLKLDQNLKLVSMGDIPTSQTLLQEFIHLVGKDRALMLAPMMIQNLVLTTPERLRLLSNEDLVEKDNFVQHNNRIESPTKTSDTLISGETNGAEDFAWIEEAQKGLGTTEIKVSRDMFDTEESNDDDFTWLDDIDTTNKTQKEEPVASETKSENIYDFSWLDNTEAEKDTDQKYDSEDLSWLHKEIETSSTDTSLDWLTERAKCVRLYAEDDSCELNTEFEESYSTEKIARSVFLGDLWIGYSTDRIEQVLEHAYGDIENITTHHDDLLTPRISEDDLVHDESDSDEDVQITKSITAPSREHNIVFSNVAKKFNLIQKNTTLRLRNIISSARRLKLIDTEKANIVSEGSFESEEFRNGFLDAQQQLRILENRLAKLTKINNELNRKWKDYCAVINGIDNFEYTPSWPDNLEDMKLLKGLPELDAKTTNILKRKAASFCKYAAEYTPRLNLVLEQFETVKESIDILHEFLSEQEQEPEDTWKMLSPIELGQTVKFRNADEAIIPKRGTVKILSVETNEDNDDEDYMDDSHYDYNYDEDDNMDEVERISLVPHSSSAIVTFKDKAAIERMQSHSVHVLGLAFPFDNINSIAVNSGVGQRQFKVYPEVAESRKTLIVSGFPVNWSVTQVITALKECLEPGFTRVNFGIHETSKKMCANGYCVIDFDNHAHCHTALRMIEKQEEKGYRLVAGFYKMGHGKKKKKMV